MGPDTLGVFIPIIAIFMSLMIPIIYTITDYRRRRDIIEAHHKERLAAIERGTDIPPLPESFYQPIQRRPPRRTSARVRRSSAPPRTRDQARGRRAAGPPHSHTR